MNKYGSAAYLKNSKRNIEGNLVIEPVAAKIAIDGRVHKGANQIIAQNALAKENCKTGLLISQEAAKKYGIYIDYKNTPGVTLTTPPATSNNEVEEKETAHNFYKYYFVEKLDEKTQGAIAVQTLNYRHQHKLDSLHAKLEKAPEQEKANVERYLLNENRNHIFRKIIRDQEIKYGTKNMKENPEYLNETVKNIEEYLSKLPENERKAVENTIISADKSREESIKGLITSYNYTATNKYALEEINKINNTLETKRESKGAIIDARNTPSSTAYLGKYLAATSLNAQFVTDKESQDSVQKELSEVLDQEFAKSNPFKVYHIGKDASDMCKAEMSTFLNKSREQQQSVTKKQEYIQERPEQTVEDRTF